MWPKSIVFRTALYAVTICAMVCVVVFAILYQMQKTIYESRFLQDAELNLAKASSVLMGYFYGQGNWVYLEERQKFLNQSTSVIYSYIVNQEGVIEVGREGLTSSDIGQRRQSWEPDISYNRDDKVGRYLFKADAALAEAYPAKVHEGDNVVVMTATVGCFEYKGDCGNLRVAISFSSLTESLAGLTNLLIICGVLITVLVAAAVFFVLRRNLLPIRNVSEQMAQLAKQATAIAGDELDITSNNREAQETRFFKDSLQKFTTAFQKTSAMEAELKVARSLSDLATQVAHDIRSPLAALEMVTANLSQLPEEKRVLLRGALSRIRDISNGLLATNPPPGSGEDARQMIGSPKESPKDSTVKVDSQSYLLSSLVDVLLSEKRMQFRSRIGVEIEGRLGSQAYGLFVKVDPREFKRVISNLVNNAVEGIADAGNVSVVVEPGRKGWVKISVQDNGKGIPSEVLPKISEKGFSYHKEGGNGLGLFHAKNCVREWGGTLSIHSKVNEGTTIEILLPRAEAPQWFVPTISIQKNSYVVIVDDDSSVHHIWQGRLESILATQSDIEVLHFSAPQEFTSWYLGRRDKSRPTCFLVDYEFVGLPETGIDLIEGLAIQSNSILVTSRFEEPHLIRTCQRMNLRLLPKGLAGFVPMQVEEVLSPLFDAVLIDDDPLVAASWQLRAKECGKKLLCVTGGAEFKKFGPQISKQLPIFVDSNLSSTEKGEELTRQLSDEGFTNLYLVTGYAKDQFGETPWLKDILDKNPPTWFFNS